MPPLPTRLAALVPEAPTLRTSAGVEAALRTACAAHPDLAALHPLGQSEEGRPIFGVTLGRGPASVCLLAGAHADEPVGPETLRTLVLGVLARPDAFGPLLDAFRLVVVPHVNPDGEARNQTWIRRWPDLGAFLREVDREPPGRDVEFGFPDLRPENRHVAAFMARHGPFALHMSLHGMAFSEGAMLLVERHWCGQRSAGLRRRFAAAAAEAGLCLHDHNRKGEKGFFYVEPGFTTTPEGAAMRAHFLALGDPETAARFRDSSMEYARRLGGDPLCLVTELPLFLVPADDPVPGHPTAYLRFQERRPELVRRLQAGEPDREVLAGLDLRPLALRTAMRLQMATLAQALEAVRGV